MSLIRSLNEYKWELIDKKVVLINKKLGISFTLDKIRLMSFMKFAPNCLDKMRIDEGKKLKKSLQSKTDKNKSERERLNAKIKALKEQLKNKKAKKKGIEPENINLFAPQI